MTVDNCKVIIHNLHLIGNKRKGKPLMKIEKNRNYGCLAFSTMGTVFNCLPGV